MLDVFKGLIPERILILSPTNKTEALKILIRRMAETDAVGDREEFERAIFEREQIMSTSIGLGVAVPHARLDSVQEIAMAIGVSPEGIDFDAFDARPIQIIIMISAPAGTQREYLSILAKIALLLKNQNFRENVIKVITVGYCGDGCCVRG